jgi:hypothetical protein
MNDFAIEEASHKLRGGEDSSQRDMPGRLKPELHTCGEIRVYPCASVVTLPTDLRLVLLRRQKTI